MHSCASVSRTRTGRQARLDRSDRIDTTVCNLATRMRAQPLSPPLLEDAVDLWRRTGLTRLWNDPEDDARGADGSQVSQNLTQPRSRSDLSARRAPGESDGCETWADQGGGDLSPHPGARLSVVLFDRGYGALVRTIGVTVAMNPCVWSPP